MYLGFYRLKILIYAKLFSLITEIHKEGLSNLQQYIKLTLQQTKHKNKNSKNIPLLTPVMITFAGQISKIPFLYTIIEMSYAKPYFLMKIFVI